MAGVAGHCHTTAIRRDRANQYYSTPKVELLGVTFSRIRSPSVLGLDVDGVPRRARMEAGAHAQCSVLSAQWWGLPGSLATER